MPVGISRLSCVACAAVIIASLVSTASADTFGAGVNQFDIEFITISGATNPPYGNRGIVNNDYRIGVYEITNDQWNKFEAAYGPVTGSPSSAYDNSTYDARGNIPANDISWYEAAQFINWLNISTKNQPAYKFTGTIHTGDYTFAAWDPAQADGANVYRHKNAKYYLPTENEWVKAGYWNGVRMQTYATPDDSRPIEDVEANYGFSLDGGFWSVTSGSEELHGTYNMMGNVWEWTENTWSDPNYGPDSHRTIRGGCIDNAYDFLWSSYRHGQAPWAEAYIGVRVASDVPEPASMSLLALGAMTLIRRRRKHSA